MYVVVMLGVVLLMFFFFFKQKTAYEMRISDWSSDVCSSDLATLHATCFTEAWGAAFIGLLLAQPGGGALLATDTTASPEAAGMALFRAIGSASCRERVCPDV